ncbi:calnexin-like isoform X1 [Apis laboriosa]|uniref:calnexin-like isoform X1 n=1 Tax=Apis laboriosa TaxID=183418 RepID=UPI001CC5B40A|nr:calnexin-like isoform X1 [Apis laboriosa]XP_043786170.1 calnexin-like isoform X1 [Apis laboriosa]XP_043786173.1 calnexin-like isoform X1 [Apis laboriosa]
MARLVANLIIYLCLLCSSINANESNDNNDENVASKVVYKRPEISGFAYLIETFDDEEKFKEHWILSEAKKDSIDEDIAKYDGIWSIEEPKKHAQEGDLGLVLKSKARHAAISTKLFTPFYFNDKPLIVQYEVNFQDSQECGGAYLKLLTLHPEHQDLKKFHDKTPYTIMFGPDKCGNDHKLHFIFRHKNPLNGSIEEKHCKKPRERLEDFFKDKQPHLYTLIIRPDNNFEIKIDNKIVNSGSLLDDFTPPVNPPLEIEDPTDVQPEDWDDKEKIPDLSAIKPDDWDEDAPAQIVDEDDIMPEGWLEDEPPMIPNPDSVKPDDWDIEMDGEWEPPEIPNPKCTNAPGCGLYKQKMKKNPRYKGKWSPPLINNPNYKGKWKPKLIHNPNYFNDEHPFQMMPIFAVGFELWSMSTDILFDNIVITHDEEVAKYWADNTFEVRRAQIAEESVTLWGRILKATNYKPGWWALYFIYCAIPVILYIWYLLKRIREWSVWRQIGTFTAEHPWIWGIYIIAPGLPILLVIYCCCFASQDKYDLKDDDKQSLVTNEQVVKQEETENLPPSTEEIEKLNENEEIIESEENDKPEIGSDGPRRRKPNKE